MNVIGFCAPSKSGKDTAADYLLNTRKGYVKVAFADELKRITAKLFRLKESLLWGLPEVRDNSEILIEREDVVAAAERLPQVDIFSRAGLNEIKQALFAALEPELPILRPRRLLQLLGTEWARAVQSDVWLEAHLNVVRALRYGADYDQIKGILPPEKGVGPKYTTVLVTDVRFPNEVSFLRSKESAAVYWIEAKERLKGQATTAHSSEPTYEALKDLVTGVLPNNLGLAEFYQALAKV